MKAHFRLVIMCISVTSQINKSVYSLEDAFVLQGNKFQIKAEAETFSGTITE